MISLSTWLNPYVTEVLEIPIAMVLGISFALFTKKAIMGPLIHLFTTFLCYLGILLYFYSADTADFLAMHMSGSEPFFIEVFFVSITWLLSWSALKFRSNQDA